MIKKFAQIMMVLAIFNPFCCCTAELFAVNDMEATPVSHGCCGSETQDASNSEKSDHDPSSCPHKALKDYQVSLEKSTTATHDLATFLPALLAVIEFMLAEPVAQSQHHVTLATASHAPPLALSQVYCVYRI
ncbi:MAG TPA: hypothetical protein DCX06_02270 [Opitutae bacterium]|nr:hypothetical protein [Opitutae bacterium]